MKPLNVFVIFFFLYCSICSVGSAFGVDLIKIPCSMIDNIQHSELGLVSLEQLLDDQARSNNQDWWIDQNNNLTIKQDGKSKIEDVQLLSGQIIVPSTSSHLRAMNKDLSNGGNSGA